MRRMLLMIYQQCHAYDTSPSSEKVKRDGVWFDADSSTLLIAVFFCWVDVLLVPACCWAYSALSI